LSDIDNIITAADSGSPFARYADELSPAFRKLLRDYVVQLRRDLLRLLERHNAMPPGRRVSAVHAIRTGVQKKTANCAVRRALFKDLDQLRPFNGEFRLSKMAARSGVP
jgi:hypothetical protein